MTSRSIKSHDVFDYSDHGHDLGVDYTHNDLIIAVVMYQMCTSHIMIISLCKNQQAYTASGVCIHVCVIELLFG
jgi:hypothetical protein